MSRTDLQPEAGRTTTGWDSDQPLMPASEQQQLQALGRGEVHVWKVQLCQPQRALSRLQHALSPMEQSRAASLRRGLLRRRFVVSRGLTRLVLSEYAGIAPGKIKLALSASGKPSLHAASNSAGLRFNLAHSGDLVLLALSRWRALGIDVEQVRPQWKYQEVVGRAFSPAEASALRLLPASLKRQAFYTAWVRKEAYLKALGCGIGDPMREVEVAIDPRVPASVLRDGQRPGRFVPWRLLDIPVPEGYQACLAVAGTSPLSWRSSIKWRLAAMADPLEVSVAGPRAGNLLSRPGWLAHEHALAGCAGKGSRGPGGRDWPMTRE